LNHGKTDLGILFSSRLDDVVNKLAARANVKTVVLSHLSARAGTDDYTPWAEEVKKQFSGQVLIAEDLMKF
jgi:ribonuclease BN (tRNA processing enzyme)